MSPQAHDEMLQLFVLIGFILFVFAGGFAVGWQECENKREKKTLRVSRPCIICRNHGGCGQCE
jgi:hypothetical protein